VDEEFLVELLTDSQSSPEIDVITREQIAILRRLLGTLPREIREMLVLRYILGWQVKQIAGHLALNENNVSVTIRRALKRLQHDWPQEKDDE
jgi:RNA polymerase sigma factor (sigma-70 family)